MGCFYALCPLGAREDRTAVFSLDFRGNSAIAPIVIPTLLWQFVPNSNTGILLMTRIDDTFARLNAEGKKAFVAYVMAGDPDFDTSLEVVRGLPEAGVDIIELGLPFTDPMADGPTIQLAGQRALEQGMTLESTLDLARKFRETDNSTPIVLMGYYNPIYSRGVETFLE